VPAYAARGPLRRLNAGLSYLLHLGGLGLFAFAMIVFYPSDFIDFLEQIIQDPFDPTGELLGLAFLFLMIELMYLLVALMTSCWGAGIESWRSSYYRTLARWYQLTPWHAALGVGLVIGIEAIDEIENLAYGSSGLADFIGYSWAGVIVTAVALFFVGSFLLLGLWSTLATLAVHRDNPTWFPSCRWPASCERCGYALAGLSDAQSCPECGRPVAASKYAQRAPLQGNPLRAMVDALVRPSMLGSGLITRSRTPMPALCLLIALGLTILVGPVGVMSVHVIERIRFNYSYDNLNLSRLIETLFNGLLAGVFMAVAAALMILTVGSLLAGFTHMIKNRQCMPAYCKAACLASGMLPFWALSNFGFIMAMILIIEYIENLQVLDTEFLVFLLWFGFNLCWLAWYAFVVDRIARAGRHANV